MKISLTKYTIEYVYRDSPWRKHKVEFSNKEEAEKFWRSMSGEKGTIYKSRKMHIPS